MLSDFDGTITVRDVGESIVKEFSRGRWQEIEEKYLAGVIGSREALIEQFSLVRVPESQILDFVDTTAEIDRDFFAFQRFCEGQDISLAVVSEGLDFYISFLFRKYGVDIEVFTNTARFTEDGIEIDFPNASEDCDLCGTCKLARVKALKQAGKKAVYVGNGKSDYCPAKASDVIFAKGSLARLLDDEGMDYHGYESFGDIIALLEALT